MSKVRTVQYLGTYNVHTNTLIVKGTYTEDALKSAVLACTYLTQALISSIAAVIA